MSHAKMPQPKMARGRGRTRVGNMLPLLMFAAVAVAQETRDLSEASLEELTNIQVYSASNHMQSARDAPSSVTVITADQIQKYGYRTLGDILRGVRGLYITSDRNYSYVGVRGFERQGDWNSRVLFTSIYNILDKKYFDPGRPEDVQDAIQQDGRSFRIKLTGRF